MPPSIVLEVLRITEAEMDLRTTTRATEQSRTSLRREEFDEAAKPLHTKQTELDKRTDVVVERIIELPDGAANFGREIAALRSAAKAMVDAMGRLVKPDTGPVAIAAESEAIEFLLQARRMVPGGGGGGSMPGGGGSGTTNISALALAGRGDSPNAKIERRNVESAAGKATDEIPEEFRTALDVYFNGLEK